MNDLVMRCIARCTKVNGRSRAQMFKNVRAGDEIVFALAIKPSKRSASYIYAQYLDIKNLSNQETAKFSLNEVARIIKNFEFEQVKQGEQVE